MHRKRAAVVDEEGEAMGPWPLRKVTARSLFWSSKFFKLRYAFFAPKSPFLLKEGSFWYTGVFFLSQDASLFHFRKSFLLKRKTFYEFSLGPLQFTDQPSQDAGAQAKRLAPPWSKSWIRH